MPKAAWGGWHVVIENILTCCHHTQASRDNAASAAADQLRRDQLALKQSKQLIPILAPASKGRPYKSPAATHSTTIVLANGTKTSALLNGGIPRKSSLESLGRMNSQVMLELCRRWFQPHLHDECQSSGQYD